MRRTFWTVVTILSGGLALGFQEALAQAVTTVQVAPPTVTLAVGQRTSVFATAFDATGNVLPNLQIRWTTTNAAVLKVEPDNTSPDVAVLVGVAAGAAIVEARIGNRRGAATVQVGGVAATSRRCRDRSRPRWRPSCRQMPAPTAAHTCISRITAPRRAPRRIRTARCARCLEIARRESGGR